MTSWPHPMVMWDSLDLYVVTVGQYSTGGTDAGVTWNEDNFQTLLSKIVSPGCPLTSILKCYYRIDYYVCQSIHDGVEN